MTYRASIFLFLVVSGVLFINFSEFILPGENLNKLAYQPKKRQKFKLKNTKSSSEKDTQSENIPININGHLNYELMQKFNVIVDTLQNPHKLGETQTHQYGQGMFRFLRRSNYLNAKVDAIARLKNINTSSPQSQTVIKTTNIIYNRINKAGSTSLLSKLLRVPKPK